MPTPAGPSSHFYSAVHISASETVPHFAVRTKACVIAALKKFCFQRGRTWVVSDIYKQAGVAVHNRSAGS